MCCRRHRGLGLVALLAGLAALGSGRAAAGAVELLVPAYFYPAGVGLQDWNELTAAAGSVGVTAILNPASGPGMSPDPNYVAVVDSLRAAGGKVVGYVFTSYGDETLRPLPVV